MKSHPEYPIYGSGSVVDRFAHRGYVTSIVALGALLFLAFYVCNVSAQAGSPAAHINIAPPTGSVAPRTGSVAPPTAAFGNGGFGLTALNSILGHGVPHSPKNPPIRPHNGGYPYLQNSGAGIAYYPYFYPVAVPYADDTSGDQTTDQADDAEAQDVPGGSAWGAQDEYAPPIYNGPMRPYDQERQDAEFSQAVDPAPEAPQPATTLVFKDGHQLEVENYAIVGETLYDLTPGHVRKVALASLDLEATEKQNDDRGVIFQLPPSPLGN
jgi:hypothetical protein